MHLKSILTGKLFIRSCNISVLRTTVLRLSSLTRSSKFLKPERNFLNSRLPYLPTPPLGRDMTQGQFLSGV